jgi:hypothetical protein
MPARLKRKVKMQWLLPAVIVVSVGAVILVTHSGPAPLIGAAPETGQAINMLESIELGGERQWISIRGHDVIIQSCCICIRGRARPIWRCCEISARSWSGTSSS